jgi:hypothetical protein
MKFKLDESRSDIATLVHDLHHAEQDNRAAKGDPALRALLARAAHMLNESQSLMTSAIHTLEDAAKLKAGFMDSASRHDDIARAKNAAMTTTADFFRSMLNQHTPTEPPKARPGVNTSMPIVATPDVEI